jgi:hypothetical protein
MIGLGVFLAASGREDEPRSGGDVRLVEVRQLGGLGRCDAQ